ncbi:DUF6355 family natural product biosynthesis protein [Lentzea sp. E54]|uniref:DUF6355 family natural product biosynthesis protein n=1 Tax=Lentzea xerophila TaxID=3435883 RepID=UPI003DA20992
MSVHCGLSKLKCTNHFNPWRAREREYRPRLDRSGHASRRDSHRHDRHPSNAASTIFPRPCGFYSFNLPQGEQTGGYVHCGDSFILIKAHWSTGNTFTSCLPPWGSRPFFKDGPHKVVNAYYVSTRPNLSGPPGNQTCSTGQPRA